MRTSEIDSALKEETIGKKLKGEGTSVLVCCVVSEEVDPCNILSSIPISKKFAMP